ncbi:pyridoxal phosphate-dependent decarboxylase family protein [Aspergillus aculeatinus CBS 121060]|uniref:PLP-dependent transferase n=1 Tax=Aspergillus aculeatinus CBS 121060 TaxID=1448322 RepID=A0ACD1H3Z8_9EURO|nr:PLP-dependent transferase [Aspergillus aculeatinus CBS 121060]RAH68293.1 PLP-dependent transferase [Aspergillus aculeatinus CBS 121060]
MHWPRIQHLLAELLDITPPPRDAPITQHTSAQDLTQIRGWARPGPPQPLETVIAEAQTIFDHRLRVNHPLFFGFIPSGTIQLSWVGDVLVAAFNAHGGGRKVGRGPCVVEEELLRWLAARLGLPARTAGGVFVSGGSVANLMSIAVARDQRLDGAARGVIYLSEQAHYAVAKMARVLGFADRQVHRVRCSEVFELDVGDLQAQVVADRRQGLLPFMIVATCGYTETGTVDPLAELADIARRESLWLHVDGAYGASVALSHAHAHLVAGLGAADSVAWDAHKWIFSSFGCGMLLVRDRGHLCSTFGVQSELMDQQAGGLSEQLEPWDLSVELTRPARAMSLWFMLRVLGEGRIGRMIDYGIDMAASVQARLQAREGWEILTNAKLGIVTFRYNPGTCSGDGLDRINTTISDRLVEDNLAGIFSIRVSGVVGLRMCCITTRLSEEDIDQFIQQVDKTAKQVGKDF